MVLPRSMVLIPVVDENDEIIGYKQREDLTPLDIYRVTALWLTNSLNQVLLARRAYTKTSSPGKWGPAAAGTVEKGENYKDNITKEMAEEIGLIDIQPVQTIKELMQGTRGYIFFCQWYCLQLDREIERFKLQASEVAEVRWFPRNELEWLVQENPLEFISSVPFCLRRSEF